MRISWTLAVALMLGAVAEGEAEAPSRGPRTDREAGNPRPSSGDLPLWRLGVGFVENMGQWPSSVACRASCSGYDLFLDGAGAVVAVGGDVPLRLGLAEPVRTSPTVEGPGRVSLLRGGDASRWVRGARHFLGAEQRGSGKGVSLDWRIEKGLARFDVRVEPGTDPADFALAVGGARAVRIDGEGRLALSTARGTLVASRPVAWNQAEGARRPVEARWTLRGDGSVGFAVSGRDPALPLVIDPTREYASLIGGTGPEGPAQSGTSAAVGPGSSGYFAGSTTSTDFPASAGAVQTAIAGYRDAVVARFAPDGALVYATLLGGTKVGGFEWDEAQAIAVDAGGNAYVTGETEATDFPTTGGAFDGTWGGGQTDAFVAKIAPDGTSLVWSTFLGGSSNDAGQGIAVDPATGVAWAGGKSASLNFPAVGTIAAPTGIEMTYVTKFSADGASVTYSTLFGSAAGNAFSMAVDGTGAVFVAGGTSDDGLPTTGGAFQEAYAGGSQDCFVAKLLPAGNGFAYFTYLGGTGSEHPNALAIDGSGRAVLFGRSNENTDFPAATPGAAQPARAGDNDYFVLRLSADGSALDWATYLGGSGNDSGDAGGGVGVDGDGNVYAAGTTRSADFPVAGGLQSCLRGSSDGFVTKLSADGSTILYSTFLGGSGDDLARSLAADAAGNVIVVGGTNSPDFPASGATGPGGSDDVFVARISAAESASSCSATGTLDLALARGKLADAEKAGKDRLSVSGTLAFNGESPDGSFDPEDDALEFVVAGGDGSFVLAVPAGDGGWRVKDAKFTWKSPRGATPRVSLTLDPGSGKFRLKASKFDFDEVPSNPFSLDLEFGNDSGTAEETWTEGKPGTFRFP